MREQAVKTSEVKHRVTNLTLTPNQAEWLKLESAKTGQTKSAIIRAMIEKAASKK